MKFETGADNKPSEIAIVKMIDPAGHEVEVRGHKKNVLGQVERKLALPPTGAGKTWTLAKGENLEKIKTALA